jgi:hypothetical protein
MKTIKAKIKDIKTNPNNPRYIKDEKFKKLVQSIKELPEMLQLRPIVVNDDMVVLGGNMRLKACQKAGLKEVPIIKASDLTPEQQNEFIIKDNIGFGSWDWDILANEWNTEQLEGWGMDLPIWQDDLTNNTEYKGLDADKELDNFLNAEVKRLYLVYDSETFENVVSWLNKKMEDENVEDYSSLILKFMENEKNKSK